MKRTIIAFWGVLLLNNFTSAQSSNDFSAAYLERSADSLQKELSKNIEKLRNFMLDVEEAQRHVSADSMERFIRNRYVSAKQANPHLLGTSVLPTLNPVMIYLDGKYRCLGGVVMHEDQFEIISIAHGLDYRGSHHLSFSLANDTVKYPIHSYILLDNTEYRSSDVLHSDCALLMPGTDTLLSGITFKSEIADTSLIGKKIFFNLNLADSSPQISHFYFYSLMSNDTFRLLSPVAYGKSVEPTPYVMTESISHDANKKLKYGESGTVLRDDKGNFYLMSEYMVFKERKRETVCLFRLYFMK